MVCSALSVVQRFWPSGLVLITVHCARKCTCIMQEHRGYPVGADPALWPKSEVQETSSEENFRPYTAESSVTRAHVTQGASTPETNWNSSRIEWTNCHTFQWEFIRSLNSVWMGLHAPCCRHRGRGNTTQTHPPPEQG